MRKRKKQSYGTKKSKILLAALVVTALSSTMPVYANPILNDGEPDQKNVGSAALTITAKPAGTGTTTWSGTAENSYNVTWGVPTYANVTIQNGGIWRPMDSNSIYIPGSLTIEKDAVLDLSYKYGENYPANPWTGRNGSVTVRRLSSANTVFYDGAILRLNAGVI